jgi:uncharacterized membrane protein
VIFMFPCAGVGFGYWWMVPVMMAVMLVFCFFLMKKMPGMGCCMGGRHSGHDEPDRKREDTGISK